MFESNQYIIRSNYTYTQLTRHLLIVNIKYLNIFSVILKTLL